MTTDPKSQRFHDAVLLSLHVDWAASVASIELENTPEVRVKLVVYGLWELTMTKHDDWGPSVSVNTLDVQIKSDEEASVAIEMQSGDNIIIVGRQVASS